MKELSKSKTIQGIVIGIGIVVLILGILHLGMVIGYHKARFAGTFENNFERNFLGPRPMMRNKFDAIPSGHGVVGKIINISLPNIVISGSDNLEKTVVVSTSTLIRRFQDELKLSDLKEADFVVVLGNPDNLGQIQAKLIRVMPDRELNIIKK